MLVAGGIESGQFGCRSAMPRINAKQSIEPGRITTPRNVVYLSLQLNTGHTRNMLLPLQTNASAIQAGERQSEHRRIL